MKAQMATISDVAKLAGVSTYTVSVVLSRRARVSPELTKRVLDAVQQLDYTVNDLARSLHTGSTRMVGMLIPDIASPFYAKVVRGAEDVLREAGYALILGNTYSKAEEQSRYLALFRSKQVDGLLLFVAPEGAGEARALVEARKPVVFVGRVPQGLDCDSVSADNALGTLLAIRHLLGKGHRRIGLITGEPVLSTSMDRVKGWRKAMREAGLKPEGQYIGEGDWTAESGYARTLELLGLDKPPTAIFASNFLMMTGVLRALKERKLRSPEDLEVMSSDDSDWLDVFVPRISTVAQPSYDMGSRSATLLLKRVNSPRRRFERIVLNPDLILR
jgi:DNA-binding LacI/PurR family transcriptional regulator